MFGWPTSDNRESPCQRAVSPQYPRLSSKLLRLIGRLMGGSACRCVSRIELFDMCPDAIIAHPVTGSSLSTGRSVNGRVTVLDRVEIK